MENKILLKANIKRHKGTLSGIFILTFLAAAALGTVLTIWANSERYIQNELERAGFGELTVWVANLPQTLDLQSSIEALDVIGCVETQNLIYANYTANELESDSEGQLIAYIPAESRYRFFTDDLSGYRAQPESIVPGEVYVSPSMVSMFDIKIGDKITFPIARAGRNLTLTVKGFYEDIMMGSAMIGMKGFLIGEPDRQAALALIQNAGIDALARDGAMLHIFPKEGSDLTVSELNSLLNEQTVLTEYTESVHSKETIAGFMLILQNAFSGLLIAFARVLLFVVLIVLSHSISSAIADALENTYGGDVHVHENTWPGLFGIISAMQALLLFMYAFVIVFILIVTVMTSSKILSAEQKDLGIYKTIGFSAAGLRCTFALRFALVSLLGGIIGMALAALFTDPLVGNIMRLAGISSFSSSPGSFATVLPLAIVTGLFTGFGWLSAVRIRKVPFTILTAQ